MWYDEREIPYDLLVSIPLNTGAEVVGKAGLGDELNFIPVNKFTFLSNKHPNVFALGDAAAVPASKAGSVAHFAVEGFGENFVRYTEGRPLLPPARVACARPVGRQEGLIFADHIGASPVPPEPVAAVIAVGRGVPDT